MDDPPLRFVVTAFGEEWLVDEWELPSLEIEAAQRIFRRTASDPMCDCSPITEREHSLLVEESP